MRLKTGDKVIVIAGSNKGKVGTIKKVLCKENRVIVEGVNIVHFLFDVYEQYLHLQQ